MVGIGRDAEKELRSLPAILQVIADLLKFLQECVSVPYHAGHAEWSTVLDGGERRTLGNRRPIDEDVLGKRFQLRKHAREWLL